MKKFVILLLICLCFLLCSCSADTSGYQNELTCTDWSADAVWLACKISPGKESRKASEGREKKSKFNKLKFKVMHSKIFQITRTRVDKDVFVYSFFREKSFLLHGV